MRSLSRDSFIIEDVAAREILDSRGNPTVEADVFARSGDMGRGSVPSGASKGSHEALELRDGDTNRFGGRGVKKAVTNILEKIAPAIRGLECSDQKAVDSTILRLDGTENKSILGANSILAVSMASAKCAAAVSRVPLFSYLETRAEYRLPIPMMNLINGGKHAGNSLSVQEFLLEPVGAADYAEALRVGAEVYHALGVILREDYGHSAVNVGDEGGYAPPLTSTEEALKEMMKAVKLAGYDESTVRLGLDAAATNFFDEKSGVYRIDGRTLNNVQLHKFYTEMIDSYPIATLEDPFQEEAFEDFTALTAEVGRGVKVIGDDIYVTNVSRISRGIRERSTNAVLVKPNQIGTVSETLEAMKLCSLSGVDVIISHRSGETEDTFISHLAAAKESLFIKAGAPARGERTAKYNELLRIHQVLGSSAKFASLG
jgi:enolase